MRCVLIRNADNRIWSACSVCFDIVYHRWFDPAILCMIILNMVVICMTYRCSPPPEQLLIDVSLEVSEPLPTAW